MLNILEINEDILMKLSVDLSYDVIVRCLRRKHHGCHALFSEDIAIFKHVSKTPTKNQNFSKLLFASFRFVVLFCLLGGSWQKYVSYHLQPAIHAFRDFSLHPKQQFY